MKRDTEVSTTQNLFDCDARGASNRTLRRFNTGVKNVYLAYYSWLSLFSRFENAQPSNLIYEKPNNLTSIIIAS